MEVCKLMLHSNVRQLPIYACATTQRYGNSYSRYSIYSIVQQCSAKATAVTIQAVQERKGGLGIEHQEKW